MNATTTTVASTRVCNTLSHVDMYKLTRWVEQNQAALKGKTQEKIAQEAGEAVGLKLTVPNIHAVSKILGIPLGLYVRKVRGKSIPSDTSRSLARAIRDLYVKLGEPVPPVVDAIASR